MLLILLVKLIHLSLETDTILPQLGYQRKKLAEKRDRNKERSGAHRGESQPRCYHGPVDYGKDLISEEGQELKKGGKKEEGRATFGEGSKQELGLSS